jgi:predicted DNA-binding protein
MSDSSPTSITLRLPLSLRERLKKQAKKEERTESQFVRYHLSLILEQAGNSKPRKSA